MSIEPNDSHVALLAELGKLWAEADDLWERNRDADAFHGYVSSDFQCVYASLSELRGSASRLLEWGSGLGVVTIMASRLGYEAYGIEAEPELVEYSREFAEAYGPDACFAQGSFIPDDLSWRLSEGEEASRTIVDTPAAYAEMDYEIRDFDLVFAYPWPDEHAFFQGIVRQFARPDCQLLLYDAREGLAVTRVADL